MLFKRYFYKQHVRKNYF